MKVIEQQDGVEAIFVDEVGTITQTSGMENFEEM